MGWLPGVYLEIVQRRPQGAQRQITEKGDGEEGRVNTMSSLGVGGGGESRSNSLLKGEVREKVPVPVGVNIGDKGDGIGGGVEGFQRGGYYS